MLKQQLIEGNNRFVNNTPMPKPVSYDYFEKLSKKQTPFATIITCSDSRVPPELIFDQPLGALFVVRVAGNTLDCHSLASVEYGLCYLNTPLLLILGHQNCGAVQAAFDLESGNFSSHLTTLLKTIEPCVKKTKKEMMGAKPEDQLKEAIIQNVFNTKKQIINEVKGVHELLEKGPLEIETAFFEITSGKVIYLNP